MEEEMSWKNQMDNPDNKEYCVDPLEPQKRLRVWMNQQKDDVLQSLTPKNYLTEFARFLKGCDNLSRCYKNHEELGHIFEIRLDFWQRYQSLIKLKIKPMIKQIHQKQIRNDLERMKMYGDS